MGLVLISKEAPAPSCMVDVPDNGLPSWKNVDVFNADGLFATAPKFRESLRLGREGPQQFRGESAE
jgi:hypothetical protein